MYTSNVHELMNWMLLMKIFFLNQNDTMTMTGHVKNCTFISDQSITSKKLINNSTEIEFWARLSMQKCTFIDKSIIFKRLMLKLFIPLK